MPIFSAELARDADHPRAWIARGIRPPSPTPLIACSIAPARARVLLRSAPAIPLPPLLLFGAALVRAAGRARSGKMAALLCATHRVEAGLTAVLLARAGKIKEVDYQERQSRLSQRGDQSPRSCEEVPKE